MDYKNYNPRQAALTEAMRGCSAAFYLVHSMRPGARDFAAIDRRAACNACHVESPGGPRNLKYEQ